jgi:hypothetical protein
MQLSNFFITAQRTPALSRIGKRRSSIKKEHNTVTMQTLLRHFEAQLFAFRKNELKSLLELTSSPVSRSPVDS